MPATLPPPREAARPYRIALVCLGNICRSPMAHVVLERKVRNAGLADRVVIESSGTGDWHLGEPMDERAAATLAAAGYDPSRHRARQVGEALFTEPDLVLVMDEANLRDVRALAPADADPARLLMFRAFDPAAGGDDAVPDPWYGGQRGFDEVLAIVERTTEGLIEQLSRPG